MPGSRPRQEQVGEVLPMDPGSAGIAAKMLIYWHQHKCSFLVFSIVQTGLTDVELGVHTTLSGGAQPKCFRP